VRINLSEVDMKKLLLLAGLLSITAGFASAQISSGGTVWVSVKTVTLKSSAGFFGSGNGVLVYGDQATVLQVKGNYAEIRSAKNASLRGWVPGSNLSTKIIVPSGAGSVSASEIALAGKGFSQELENAYKAEGDLDYADVDKTEAITVSDNELYKFITDGHLKAGEE
jgi:hypothetical protein